MSAVSVRMPCPPGDRGVPGRGMAPGAEKWDHGECRRATSKEKVMEGKKDKVIGRVRPPWKGLDCRAGRWDFTHKAESPKSSQLSESSDWPRKGLRPGIHIVKICLCHQPSPFAPPHSGS